MPHTESVTDAAWHDDTLLAAVRNAAADARAIANRYVFSGMLATSGLASLILRRILPERHGVLPDHGTLWALLKLQSQFLSRFCGVRVAVHGRERLAAGGPFVFVANHQSYFDIVALLAFLPGRVRFVVTQELAEHAFWGPLLRALGMVVVDDEVQSTEGIIQGLESIVDTGASVVIFPEGHRGQRPRLLPFDDLPFLAIIELGIPVVPVAIRGMRAVMPAGRSSGIEPGDVEVLVEEPIPTEHLLAEDYRPLREDVRAAIARYVEEMDSLLDANDCEAEGEADETDIVAMPLAEPGHA